jgi:Zn-dependent protease with chaperone function
MKGLIVVGVVLLLGAVTMRAQAPTPAAPSPSVADADETRPVAVPEPSPLALEYYRSSNWLWVADQIWSMLLLVAVLATGLSARLRDLAMRLTRRRWFFALAAYFILFTLITTVVDLPRAYYEEFVRQHAYGLSNQTAQKWWTDGLTALALSSVIGPLVVWVPYLLLSNSPRRWWLYSALALIPFIVVGNLVAPIWIAPLFNRFGPMKDKALEAEILALADRAGIEGSRVFEVEKSVDTKTLNAYVAGLFNTKRIVLWDTTIARMNERELLFVMGHEMGHFVLGHVWLLVAANTVLIMVLFYGAYRTAGGVLRRYGERFGFSRMDDIASLPLLLLLVGVFSLVAAPIGNALTRHFEHEADRFGLEITQFNHSAANAFVKLQTDALAVPRPGLLNVLWRQSHPPLGERIDFANAYHPWRDGGPLVYGGHFKR